MNLGPGPCASRGPSKQSPQPATTGPMPVRPSTSGSGEPFSPTCFMVARSRAGDGAAGAGASPPTARRRPAATFPGTAEADCESDVDRRTAPHASPPDLRAPGSGSWALSGSGARVPSLPANGRRRIRPRAPGAGTCRSSARAASSGEAAGDTCTGTGEGTGTPACATSRPDAGDAAGCATAVPRCTSRRQLRRRCGTAPVRRAGMAALRNLGDPHNRPRPQPDGQPICF